MNDRLAGYLELFARIRADTSPKRWGESTCYRAPHKPLFLLSVFDLIASGGIVDNFITPSFELSDLFAGYWLRIMPPGTTGLMCLPFYHLATSGFWNLIPQPSILDERGRSIQSIKRFVLFYQGAKFNDDLFFLLKDELVLRRLRSVLIETYFAPDVQLALTEQAIINLESSKYSCELLGAKEITVQYERITDNEGIKNKVRSQGFRKAIVKLYEHRCALCGLRMLTPEGHTVVEAAHIIPWSASQNDQPQNGMALCRLCHWFFDEGLMGIGQHYEILVSPVVRQDGNYPGHIETMTGRVILKPEKKAFWPHMEYLEIHRKETFRKK
ncbi:putative restriction endonuclease [Candidatus Electrothrix marina]|uniref:Putative restriction endonuclease n=1 Tax=Candidatus Electrothrix marina TaxID=1859130 RepID=A0A444JGN2_9BACT|nr:putative restriction endonuclease [Candidatus Electrothrix marina]